ncbi:hypothetical protein PG637_10785 [Riemerella anatipestifer]|nr:hypothetical protein [Riemerella anatipestifer]MDY3326152.1 hypothetical protein [Riemerella anatipestifer]MDY3354502.1 hypothetical protein [Riemerella anatipestifer]
MRKSQKRKIIKPNKQSKSNSVTFDKLTLHKLDWLEWITIGLASWFLFFPRPYEILLGALLAIPIIGLLLNGLHKPSMATLVEVSADKDGGDKYDVADFIDIAAWVILIRVLLDYEFESIYSMIIPGTVACIIILAILFLTHKLIANTTRNKWWIYTSLIFNVSLYSYAGTYAANCTYDYSEPTVYETKVLDKRIHRGSKGRKTFYIKVAPWGHHLDKEEISVASVQYDELEVGDNVKIDLKKGLFNIPWYYVERKRDWNE